MMAERGDEASSGRSTVSRDIIATTIAGYLIQPVMFFSNILVRRELGPFLTGVFATLTIVQTYTQLCNLGVIQAAEREMPVLRGAGDQVRFAAIRTTAFIIAVVAGVVVGAGIVVYALWSRASLDPSLFRGLLVYAVMVVLTQWANAQLALLRATLQFTFLARFSVVTAFLAAGLNIVAVRISGFDGLLAATLVVALVSCGVYTRVAGLPAVREALADVSAPFSANARAMLLAGVPMLIMSSVHSVLHTIDNVMALRLLGTEWLGRYTLALSGGAVLYSFANSVTMVLYPHMQVAYGKDKAPTALAPFIDKPVRMLAAGLPLLIAPLFFGLPVLARGLLPKFVPGIPAFQCLVVGITFYALSQLPHLALLSLNKLPQIVTWTAATAGVAVGCSVMFTNVGLGLTGIAAAITVAYAFFFFGLASYAMSFWSTRRATVLLLAKASLTVVFAGALLMLADRVPLPEPSGFVADIVVGIGRVALFFGVYGAFLVVTDGETGLLRDHLYPGARRLLARLGMTSAA